jgi:dihydrofolate synthase/folylpolyglutamate synthase
MSQMDFDEAVEYLLSLGHETLAIKLGLRNTELLFREVNNPHLAFPSVQIAGTNGKGSTAAFLESICRRAKIKTGLYTSPHLQSITERIKINGVDLTKDAFAKTASIVRDAANRMVAQGASDALPTFFEQVTTIALVAFREANIALAILETGLGGRLDSTTAAHAKICAITQIALDHEEYLGMSLGSIAAEKAAIMRPGSKVVIAHQSSEALEVILNHCNQVGVLPLYDCCRTTVEEFSRDGRYCVTFETREGRYENVWLGLRGQHQIENAAIALQLAEVLRSEGFELTDSCMIDGIQMAQHAGRLEVCATNPMLLLDGAHNVAGSRALRTFLEEFASRPLTVIFGAMRDKRIAEIAAHLFPIADELILTEIRNPRSASLETLKSIAAEFSTGSISATKDSADALALALKTTPAEGTINISGSLYLVGEIRQQINNISQSEK